MSTTVPIDARLSLPGCLGFAALLLVTACDPVEVIELRRPDLGPVLCPSGERTRYTVSFLTSGSGRVATHSSRVDPTQDAFSTRPPYPLAGILAGSVEGGRLVWIQFDVYCGRSGTPFVSTPRITPQQLIKKDERLFYYIVPYGDAGPAAVQRSGLAGSIVVDTPSLRVPISLCEILPVRRK